jgi:hypothetical protein
MGGYDDDSKQITRPNPVILGLDVKAVMRKRKSPTPPPSFVPASKLSNSASCLRGSTIFPCLSKNSSFYPREEWGTEALASLLTPTRKSGTKSNDDSQAVSGPANFEVGILGNDSMML